MQSYKFTVKYQWGPKKIAEPLLRLVNGKETGTKGSSLSEAVHFVGISATTYAIL